MAIEKISPKKTKSWLKLQELASRIGSFRLTEAFSSNPDRDQKYSQRWKGLFVDYSKNFFSEEVFQTLLSFAEELDLKKNVQSYFEGDRFNETEGRSVLHPAFRAQLSKGLSELEQKEVDQTKAQMKNLCDRMAAGKLLGYSGKPIQSVVSIGTGGSYLGIKFLSEALWRRAKRGIKIHYLSNLDPDTIEKKKEELDPETTIFVVISKTFTTLETITNFKTISDWFFEKAPKNAFRHHFYAVTSDEKKAISFGFEKENCFKIWDWMGGRFSVLGPVGLPIALQIGWDDFSEILQGAHDMDIHFQKENYETNIPVVLSLLSFWQETFCDFRASAVIPYSDALKTLPDYLQQLYMESNGKIIDRHGKEIDYPTEPVTFGSVGTNAQHSFFQLFHQGTTPTSVEFVGIVNSNKGSKESQHLLNSNLIAQSKALMEGKSLEQVKQDLKYEGLQNKAIDDLAPHKTFKGNKPSTIIFIDQLNPYNLGALIALHEHKTFVKGLLWNIYSFDQWGVELGKSNQREVLDSLTQSNSEHRGFKALYNYIFSLTKSKN